MSAECSVDRPAPRWLHIWAILTVVAAAFLLVMGGLVTTFRVGMADPVWPTTPWFLFFTSWTEPKPGFIIEHAHRLVAYIIGFLILILAVGMWFQAKSCALKKLGMLCLALVCIQGLLGGIRVTLNEWIGMDLAIVHGCFAQVVFCALVATALLSASSSSAFADQAAFSPKIHKLTKWLVAVVYMQIIWGALVRHNPSPLAQRLHLITAFAVMILGFRFLTLAQSQPRTWNRLYRPCIVLAALLLVQILFGVEAWMGKFVSGIDPLEQKVTLGQAIIRGIHMLVGTGILATSVVLVIQSAPHRPVREPDDEHSLENDDRIQTPVALVSSYRVGGTS